DLDLTCLGAIQVNVNKATLDFSTANKRLYLAAGSSIEFVNGGTLNPAGGNGGGCTGNDRVYIGGVLLATCQGAAGILGFDDLISLGGTGKVSSNSPVCVGNNIVLSATPPPNGTFTYKWFGPAPSTSIFSTSQNPTPFTATTTPVTSGVYTVTISRPSDGITFNLTTTVVVNSGTLPSAPTVSPVQPTCSVATGTITVLTPAPDGVLKYSINGLTYTNTSGVFNLVTPGTYSVTVKNSSGCISPGQSETINAQPVIPDAPILSNVVLDCNEAIATETWASIPNITNYSFDVSLDSFVTYLAGYENHLVVPTATSLSVSGLNPGVTYYVKARTINSCGPSIDSNVVTITVNSLPGTPSATATSQPNCVVPKGIITVTSPTGMNYSIDGSDYSNTTGIFNNLAVGSYVVTAKNVLGCVSLGSTPVAINASVTNTWDGVKWSKTLDATSPLISDSVVFNADFNITSQLNACSCKINPLVKVVVGVVGGLNADAILKVENVLDIASSGSLTFENNASLVQVNNDAVNTGKIIYNRTATPMKNFDYTYWSSPVQGQTLYDLSPNTLWDKYLSYSLDNKWVVEAYGTSMMLAGKGYIIRVPKPQFWPDPLAATYVQSVKFEGVPNNGIYTLAIAPTGYSNLVGNPYPSAMSADAFLLENSINTNRVEATIRFWTHSTVITNNKYSSADYASYNYLGGVGTSGNFVDTNGNGIKDVGEVEIAANRPLGNIAAGQSFFVKSATVPGPVLFNNSMRVGVSGKNAQFFRGTKSKTAAIEKHRVWLNLTNSEGAFKQLLVGYATGATNGVDRVFDGLSANSNAYIDFYSINEGNNLVIQGRAVPFDKTDRVPLGYKSTIEGVFTISINEVDGVLTDQPIFIEDKVNNVVHNLKNGVYSFTTSKGIFNDRFVLRFMSNNVTAKALDTGIFDTEREGVIVSVKNSQIKINSFSETIDKVMVYDLKGSLLYEKDNVNSNEFRVLNFNSSEQFLIVQILLKNGKWVTQEIVF
ncbi:MAG TPA: T9SS sorting signal type C domain-containing protein, partial [Flavobacterium sp.]|uniref:T9SS sorting signal type C domain-containing protein n=1 Tax=Flavobacterium sp. TaxID=239 RepID=UPI002DB9E5E8